MKDKLRYGICFIILIFLIIISPEVFGSVIPNLPDPITKSTSQYSRISSDYGPRNFDGQTNNNSNPHIGIDYALAKGGQAFAVEDGNFIEIKNLENLNTEIKLGNWWYTHIINNEYKCSNYWFKIYKDQDVFDPNGNPTGQKTTIIVFRWRNKDGEILFK